MSTDYFPPIQRAVQGLSPNTQETRTALYDKARGALLRQLNAADPALTPGQISRERGLLEEAIRRVEHHYDEAELVQEPLISERPAAPRPGVDSDGTDFGDTVAVEELSRDEPVTRLSEPADQGRGLPAFAERKSERRRPQAPRRSNSNGNFKRYATMAAAGVVLVGGGIATTLVMRSGDGKGGVPPQIIAAPANPVPAPAPTDPAKLNDRIGGPPSTQVATANPAPAPETRPILPAPSSEPAQIPAPVTTTPAPLVPSTQGEAPEGQRARFIEEDPSAPQKTRAFEGTINWRTESQASGNNGPLETVIIGDLNFPDRKVKAVLTLRHNSDPALPAAYVMQVQIVVPADYPNGGVNTLKGIAVTSDPEQRGNLLDGALMKVSTGAFLLGTIDPPDEKGREARLLRNYPWFQLMFVFDNGRNAIFAFEKGADGSKVFDDAMASWSSSASAQ